MCGANASERGEIEKVLLHSTTDVERVNGSFHLSLRIEYWWLARRSWEIDAERGSVERTTCFLHVAAQRRKKIGSALPNARLCLVGAQSRSLGNCALTCSESGRVTEAEANGRRLLRDRRCRWTGSLRRSRRRHDCNRRDRCQHSAANAREKFSHCRREETKLCPTERHPPARTRPRMPSANGDRNGPAREKPLRLSCGGAGAPRSARRAKYRS